MENKLIQEGEAKIISQPGAFYNPVMKLNRDLSMLVAKEFFKNRKTVAICEPFSATGIRAIRYAKEVRGVGALERGSVDVKVYSGDISTEAVDLIKKNAELNHVKNITIFYGYAEKLLAQRKYDLVDLDPFGTPAPYVDYALTSLKPNGMLAATATDMMALCGVAPKAGEPMPKYLGARAMKCEFVHEIAVRILLGLIARKSKRKIIPLLSLSTDHYIRVFVKFGAAGHRGIEVGYVNYNPKTGKRSVSKTKKKGNKHAGPLWIGKIQDKAFVGRLLKQIDGYAGTKGPGYRDNRLKKLLETIHSEANGKPLFYTVRELVHGEQPKIEVLLKKYKATRTHFKPQAIRLK